MCALYCSLVAPLPPLFIAIVLFMAGVNLVLLCLWPCCIVCPIVVIGGPACACLWCAPLCCPTLDWFPHVLCVPPLVGLTLTQPIPQPYPRPHPSSTRPPVPSWCGTPCPLPSPTILLPHALPAPWARHAQLVGGNRWTDSCCWCWAAGGRLCC